MGILKGFLHADPHAGNLKVGPDGRLVFLDFGAVVRLKPHQGISMMKWMLSVLANDKEEYHNAAQELGLPPTLLPLEKARTAATFSDMLYSFEINAGTSKKGESVVFDSEFAVVLRPLVILEGRALEANPDFKVLETCVPMILEVAREFPEFQVLRKKALMNCLQMQLSRMNAVSNQESVGFIGHAIATVMPQVLETLGHSTRSVMIFMRQMKKLVGFLKENPGTNPLKSCNMSQEAAICLMACCPRLVFKFFCFHHYCWGEQIGSIDLKRKRLLLGSDTCLGSMFRMLLGWDVSIG